MMYQKIQVYLGRLKVLHTKETYIDKLNIHDYDK